VRRFLSTESAGGALLLVAAVIALVWANAATGSYEHLWHDDVVHHVVNDGLMSLFFLVVGIEIRRELVHGELRDPRVAALPVVAAIGGMVVPATIYALVAGDRGWGVPMATDIAFAVGVLTLLGPRIPSSLKLFLLSLAIVDDLGAVLVIAIFYGGGVHPTIVAAAIGLLLPSRIGEALETPLHDLSSYVVVPLFALANAGVLISTGDVDARIAGGVVAGLVLGKVLGISGASWLAVRTGRATMPSDTTWSMLIGVGILGGMGFTVSLFVADLAYLDASSAKIGVLVATLVAGLVGGTVLALTTRERATTPG
jgi:NhaA family Na+:H+ antiporter